MKRYLLLINAFIIIFICLLFSSCKDTTHYPHPGAGNQRLASYSLVGTGVSTLTPTINTQTANYAFSYDTSNRVTFVTFTTNDPFKSNQFITFTYSGDTIYKTITSITPSIPIEMDTFILNSLGQLAIAFTPNTSTTFQYYENLLTKVIVTNETTHAVVTTTYTSVTNNFISGLSTVGSSALQTFQYYIQYTNRIGDYYQLQSFTMYGRNIYQYANMVSSVTEPGENINFTYNIDAFSNVTQATAKATGITNDSTTVYNFQYESY